MKTTTIMRGAVIACCLISILVLPVAAAPAPRGGDPTVDQGLKADLWNAQGVHRLAVIDANIQYANNITGIIGSHGIDTTLMQAILMQITALHPSLEPAYADQDRYIRKDVDKKLLALWKQFRQETATAVRDKYRITGKGRTSSNGTVADLNGADTERLGI